MALLPCGIEARRCRRRRAQSRHNMSRIKFGQSVICAKNSPPACHSRDPPRRGLPCEANACGFANRLAATDKVYAKERNLRQQKSVGRRCGRTEAYSTIWDGRIDVQTKDSWQGPSRPATPSPPLSQARSNVGMGFSRVCWARGLSIWSERRWNLCDLGVLYRLGKSVAQPCSATGVPKVDNDENALMTGINHAALLYLEWTMDT